MSDILFIIFLIVIFGYFTYQYILQNDVEKQKLAEHEYKTKREKEKILLYYEKSQIIYWQFSKYFFEVFETKSELSRDDLLTIFHTDFKFYKTHHFNDFEYDLCYNSKVLNKNFGEEKGTYFTKGFNFDSIDANFPKILKHIESDLLPAHIKKFKGSSDDNAKILVSGPIIDSIYNFHIKIIKNKNVLENLTLGREAMVFYMWTEAMNFYLLTYTEKSIFKNNNDNSIYETKRLFEEIIPLEDDNVDIFNKFLNKSYKSSITIINLDKQGL